MAVGEMAVGEMAVGEQAAGAPGRCDVQLWSIARLIRTDCSALLHRVWVEAPGSIVGVGQDLEAVRFGRGVRLIRRRVLPGPRPASRASLRGRWNFPSAPGCSPT